MKKIFVTLMFIVTFMFVLTSCNSTTYKVEFDYSGAADNVIKNVYAGVEVRKPTDPIKEGYEFKGWYLNDELYDFTSAVTNDLTLVEKWTYELKFEDVMGSWKGVEAMYCSEMATLSLTIKADQTAAAVYEMSGYLMELTITNIAVENNQLVVSYNNGNDGTISFEYVDGKLIANKGITVSDYGTTELEKDNIDLTNAIGTWEGSESYSGMDIPYTLVVNEDGTMSASFDMFGYVTEVEYVELNNKVVFDYYGVKLIFVFDGTNFYGTGAMGQPVVLSKKVDVQEITLEDVKGTWTGSEEFYKFVINADGTGSGNYADEAGLYPSDLTITALTVEGNNVILAVTDSYSMEYTIEFTYQDGSLVSSKGLMWGSLTLVK